MSDLSTLISRLEEATGANREIDALVCIALRDVPNAKYYKEVMIFDAVLESMRPKQAVADGGSNGS